MSSTAIRERRRILRYRNLVQRQAVQMKNRISGLLMETGVSCAKPHLHRRWYFERLLTTSEDVPDSISPLLKLCREHIDRSIRMVLGSIFMGFRGPEDRRNLHGYR